MDVDVVNVKLDATGTSRSITMTIFATNTDTFATGGATLELPHGGEALATRAGNQNAGAIIDFIPNIGVGLEGIEFEHGIDILSTYRHCGR